MFKFVCILFSLFGCITKISAQENVCVYIQNGDVMEFSISEEPKLFYSDTDMIMKTTTEQVSFQISEIKSIKFGKMTPTSINANESVSSANIINVYTLDGKLIKTFNENLNPNLSVLPNGNYVIKNTKSSIKVHIAK